eukprot:s975_g48.t1
MGRFGLNEALLAEGLQSGEFYEVQDDEGKTRYAWTENSRSTTHGSSSGSKMEASKTLTKNQAAVEDAKFATWSTDLFKAAFVSGKQQKALPPGPDGPLALCDQEAPLDEGQKGIMQLLQSEKGNLSHVYMWKEMPDSNPLTVKSYGELIGHAGAMCKKLSEQLAGVKGSLQQRAKAAKSAA